MKVFQTLGKGSIPLSRTNNMLEDPQKPELNDIPEKAVDDFEFPNLDAKQREDLGRTLKEFLEEKDK